MARARTVPKSDSVSASPSFSRRKSATCCIKAKLAPNTHACS
jgi:hypothetical protein